MNRDGSNDNFSWNCGLEGHTSDAGVNALRVRQMKNMMVALMISQVGRSCAAGTNNGGFFF